MAERRRLSASMRTLASDGSVVHNQGLDIKFLTMPASSTLPFQPLVDQVNRLYAKCYRGIDLATGSRASEQGAGRNVLGASLQKEESGIFLARDAALLGQARDEHLQRLGRQADLVGGQGLAGNFQQDAFKDWCRHEGLV